MKAWVDGSTTRIAYVLSEGGCTPFSHKVIPLAGKATGNEGEYFAVIALLSLEDLQKASLEIYSDSQLIVNQLTPHPTKLGRMVYRVKEPRLKRLNCKVRKLIEEKAIDVSFRWLPREENLAGYLLE